MAREKKKNDKTNFGIAFIILDSHLTALNTIDDLKAIKRWIKEDHPKVYNMLEVYVREFFEIIFLELDS